jgi:N-acetylmuramic acid 6-phosphate (MurNAc-6-P) etherase
MLPVIERTRPDGVFLVSQVNMRPTNEKLQDRAVRILTQLFDGQGKGADECRAALEASGWVIADARSALAQ